MLETVTEKIIFTICIIFIVLAITAGAYLSFSDRCYVYYQCEVVKVVESPSILESDRKTVVVKFEDGTLMEFRGNSSIFLLVEVGNIVKVRCYMKQIYELYSIEGIFESNGAVN